MKAHSGARKAARTRRRKAAKPKRRDVPKGASPATPSQEENARLTGKLSEALEQQAATSEVLNAISRSTYDLRTVLNTLVETAAHLCKANKVQILLPSEDTNRVYSAGSFGYSAEYNEYLKTITFAPGRESVSGRVLLERKPVQIVDVLADPDYSLPEVQRLGGFRTHLGLPLFREDNVIGVLLVSRPVVEPFDNKHIELLGTFAAQAVIAIENTRLLNELRHRTADLTEALEQQTATSEVLQVISSSPGELEPVFAAMLASATRICEAKFGNLFLHEGVTFRAVAWHGEPTYVESWRREPLVITTDVPDIPLARVAETKQRVHVPDLRQDTAYRAGFAPLVTLVDRGGARTLLIVPMLREHILVGAIAIYRQEVRPFTHKQIELVENFAAQAVIAIENARLLNELRQRTGELETSLEYQTATSDVLKVISRSVFDLQKILEFVAETAARLCAAKQVGIFLLEDNVYRFTVGFGLTPAYREIEERAAIKPGPQTVVGRVALQGETVHILDVLSDPDYGPKDDVRTANVRTVLAVPLTRESKVVGVIVLARETVSSFSSEQIELVRTFADQAVIAIENARLLNELRERTNDLTESLEHQTASSEVLRVISSSHSDLERVFDSLLENATRLCRAKFGNLYLRTEGGFRYAAMHGVPSEYAEMAKQQPSDGLAQDPHSPLTRMARSKRVVHVPDLMLDEGYIKRHARIMALVESAGARTLVVVPMLKEDELVGAIAIYRQEALPFTNKQIQLVQNFAAQAVIAIENARLLKELRERSEQVEAQSQELMKLNQRLEQRVADQVGEIERMGRLRRFLPPQVADLIVASGTEKQLESHRREITALFCDLRGFTGFSESADPEDVIALLRDYHAAIGEIIIKYSGTLERYAGDGVMVVFNDPVPVENPALKAVLMALEMRTSIGALTDRWRRLGHDIGFGIGIAHGFATLGTIGFEGRFDYAAIGTVSNVASRLCDEAKPGQILISPRVFMAVEDAVTVESVGEFALKGIRRPLAAYNVLASGILKPDQEHTGPG